VEITLFIILAFYFLELFVFIIGLVKNMKRPDGMRGELPFVSVIVSAKNEEENITRCMDSLVKLDYPKDKIELLMVNDNSSDGTKDIILSYAEKYPEIKYLETEDIPSKIRGKAKALSQAVKKSGGEFIFTTDADCEVKPSWVKEMLKYYDVDTGVVSSYSIIKPKNISWAVQSLDWIYLLTIASGSDGIGNPLSCVGNNMSYRKKAYEEVGGYEKIKYSVTEDFMLLKTIRTATKWKTKFPLNADTVNYTLPGMSFMELYRQKKRWGRGGLDIVLPGYLVGLIGWCISASLLLGWLFVPVNAYLIILISKIILDIIFILPAVLRFRSFKTLLYLPLFEIYFSLYAFALPFILLFDRDVIWKEQKV
jgi:cellulose synthase/poly-beta-1,6-N-acetylglucosamine synthase-like glycosyltransferase